MKSRTPPSRSRRSDSLWYLGYYELPHHQKPPPRILELPDEILLYIATKLSRNTDLRRLSLVNKKLRGVAQEALVKEVILPPNGIRDFLQMLCDRPDLLSRIKSVDLGDYARPGKVDEMENLETGSFARKCRDLVDSNNRDGFYSEIFDAIGKSNPVLWSQKRVFFLNILVALTPSLRQLTVELPPKLPGSIFSSLIQGDSESQELMCLFQGPALKLLERRLRVLTIPEMSSWRGLLTHNFTIQPLSQLRRVCLPLETLINEGKEPTDTVKVLPPNLECLQIRPCNRYILAWLLKFGDAHLEGKFPKLRVELFFKTCLRSSILLVDQGRGVLKSFHGLIRLFARTGLTITAFAGKDFAKADLLQELDAWSHLSEFEIWLTAAKGEQFSTQVARSDDGAPRPRTKDESRLFLRGHRAPANMRISSEFAPKISIDGIPTLAFGKDVPLPDVVTPAIDPEAWKAICAFHRVSTGSMDTLMELEFSRVQAQMVEAKHDSSAFEGNFRVPGSTPAPPTFDAGQWLGVRYFGKSKTQRPKTKPLVNKAPTDADWRSTTPRPRRRKKPA